MDACSILAECSRWGYFLIAVLSVMNSFIHLHIQLEQSQCPQALINSLIASGYSGPTASQYVTAGIDCIGRNLAWREDDDFDYDTNKIFWRQVFSFQPEIFFDIWPPIILAILAVLQHFDNFKWDVISGDWMRALLFIVIWQLFTVIGYGSNFGVIIGFLGVCGVAVLYLIMCCLLFFGVCDTSIRDKPTLDLKEYISTFLASADDIRKRSHSDIRSINHDNDDIMEEQQALAPQPMAHKQMGSIDMRQRGTIDTTALVNRLSITQPGSCDLDELKHRPLPPTPVERDKAAVVAGASSHDHDAVVDEVDVAVDDEDDGFGSTPGGDIGGGRGGRRKLKNRQYAEIGQHDKSSMSGDTVGSIDEEEEEEEEENSVIIHDEYKNDHTKLDDGDKHENDDMVVIPPPPPPPTGPANEHRLESESDEDEHDGLYKKPVGRKVTES